MKIKLNKDATQQPEELTSEADSKYKSAKSTKIINASINTDSNEIQKSAITIQRLWRGNKARKEIALTLPGILTHTTKLSLWKTPQLSDKKLIESKIFAIHATDYFPINGVIRVVDPKIRGGSYFRPTTHFALGELVRPHSEGKISRENKKFAIVTPLKNLIPQLLSLNVYDTYILGDFNLSDDSMVLVPVSEAVQFRSLYPNLNIVSYDPIKGLRLSIKDLIDECGGWPFMSFENNEKLGPWAPAISSSFDCRNINTPEFFAPILREQKNVAFGAHNNSLFGSAYHMGIIDNALTQLGFSPDYFGNIYNEDPAFAKILVEHLIARIESSPMISQSNAGSDILRLHIKRAREGLKKLGTSSEQKNFAGDYIKARIARLLTWPDLFLFIHSDKRLVSHIHNQKAFLCMYAFYRTAVIGEQSANKEGLATVFSNNLNWLEESMRIHVIGTILAIRSNMTHKADFPGGLLYLRKLLIQLEKFTGIPLGDDLEESSDTAWKTLYAQKRLWLPTQIDLADSAGNVPLIQALIARDEHKALTLLNTGANIINVYGCVIGWSIKAPLLTIALRCGMSTIAEALLKRSDFSACDQADGWQNTPLCDAIVMGFENIAASLIERGANVNQCPNYAGVAEKDLVSLASRMGLEKVVMLLQERGCIVNNSSKQPCVMM